MNPGCGGFHLIEQHRRGRALMARLMAITPRKKKDRQQERQIRKDKFSMGKLDGKVAVITGATSGMALATAKLFVKEGAYVFLTGRRKDKVDEAVKAIGRNVTGVQGDAANLADLDRLYEIVKKEKGKIDVLFASAGRGEMAKIGEVTEEQFDQTFDLNVRGTLFTVQKALPLFSDGGSIFLNGSIASIKGIPAFGVYSASKAAVRSFARTWLVDLKERKIRVNVLSPGTIDTPILDPLGPDAKEFFKSQIPRGEMGRPEEIATVALFLASSDSSFVNGIELFVDGGTAQI
jgi:NAD(P)-dependent dehydrogenase (short-subunit alcohol dehydrogenase family)